MGEGTPQYQARFATLREVLRDAPEGVDTVIGALCRLRTRFPRRQAMHKALAYFREPRHRMRSSALQAQHLPIGSGVVEAACQTSRQPAFEACGDALADSGRTSHFDVSCVVSK